MIRARLKLRALGLCALALGLMTFAAGATRAETGAKWNVVNTKGELVEVKAGGLLPTIGLTEVEAGETLLTEVSKIKVEKRCTGYELIGAKLEGEGKVGNGAKARFTGCKLFLKGVETKACTPHSPGSPEGTLESSNGKGLLVLHKLASGVLDPIVRVEPVVGELFMTVILGKEGESECAIGEKIPIIGKFTIKDSQNELTTEKAVHLVSEGLLTEVWLISKTAEHVIRFDGSAIGELAGEHKGLKASGTPG
jgi:hypothetical protein